jgi:hypothetical protein
MLFLLSGSSSRRIDAACRGMREVARARGQYRDGGDPFAHQGYYWYRRIVESDSPPVDAGDDPNHVAAFGRGPEPQLVNIEEITPEESARIQAAWEAERPIPGIGCI